jgi:hypothetical protein
MYNQFAQPSVTYYRAYRYLHLFIARSRDARIKEHVDIITVVYMVSLFLGISIVNKQYILLFPAYIFIHLKVDRFFTRKDKLLKTTACLAILSTKTPDRHFSEQWGIIYFLNLVHIPQKRYDSTKTSKKVNLAVHAVLTLYDLSCNVNNK